METFRTYAKTLLAYIKQIRRMVFFAPERYWKYVLSLVGILIFIVASVDGYIFWKLALRIDADVVDPEVPVERLDKRRFDRVLETLAKQRDISRDLLSERPLPTATTTPQE